MIQMMKMNVPLQLKKQWNLCLYLKDISIIINKMNNYYGDIKLIVRLYIMIYLDDLIHTVKII